MRWLRQRFGIVSPYPGRCGAYGDRVHGFAPTAMLGSPRSGLKITPPLATQSAAARPGDRSRLPIGRSSKPPEGPTPPQSPPTSNAPCAALKHPSRPAPHIAARHLRPRRRLHKPARNRLDPQITGFTNDPSTEDQHPRQQQTQRNQSPRGSSDVVVTNSTSDLPPSTEETTIPSVVQAASVDSAGSIHVYETRAPRQAGVRKARNHGRIRIR